MKLKTVVESRIPTNIKKGKKYLLPILITSDIIVSTILPFILGFYFATTKSIIFLLLFIFMIFFSFTIRYEDDIIKIKIMRGL